MKTLIIKIDRLVLNLLTRYIRVWIERKKYKKHKIDFMIRVEWLQLWGLIIWAIAVPVLLYLVAGSVIGAVIHAAIWSILAVFEWWGIQHTINHTKPFYDFLFANREDPRFYEMQKTICEELFVEKRRQRLGHIAFMVGITIALFTFFTMVAPPGDPNHFVWQYLLISTGINSLKNYIFYVFDFDPPKRKKRATDQISEFMMRMWRDLVGGFAPQPAFSYAQTIK